MNTSVSYPSVLSNLVEKNAIANVGPVFTHLTPHLSEDARGSIKNGLKRGAVRVAIPPVFYAKGSHSINLTQESIRYLEYVPHLEGITQGAELAAESFASTLWREEMGSSTIAAILICRFLPPGGGQRAANDGVSLLLALGRSLDDIMEEARAKDCEMRAVLDSHILRVASDRVSLHEVEVLSRQMANSRNCIKIEEYEFCCGCGRHVFQCRCLGSRNIVLTSKLAIPCRIMESMQPIFEKRFGN